MSNFNFFCYCSKSILQTEELVSMFMNEALQVNYIYIIIKPNAHHFTEQIFDHLEKILGYYVIDTYELPLNDYDFGKDNARRFL